MVTYQEIADIIDRYHPLCTCGNIITGDDIRMYPHEAGIEVGCLATGYTSKQWVYFHCDVCNYDWALWKLLNRILNKSTRHNEKEAIKIIMESWK